MPKTTGKTSTFKNEPVDESKTAVFPKEFHKKLKKEKTPWHLAEEYPRSIMKIASYSGVTRIVDCNDKKCGGYDKIVNIYVYPEGIVDDYPNTVVDPLIGDNKISKQGVRDHGHDNMAIWRKREMRSNLTSEKVKTTSRIKKSSQLVKRIASHKKHKKN
jgi:hypothetical protein